MPKINNSSKIDKFISVVVVTDPQSVGIEKEVKELTEVLYNGYTNYEIIIVDNKLRTGEINKLYNLLSTLPCIRVVRLTREYSKDVCVFVGLESAIGDLVVIKSISDPTKLVNKFIGKINNHDLVFGISKRRIRPGLVNNYGAKLFYWYNKRFLDITIPERSTYFMAFSRRAVNSVTRNRQYARHIRYLARQIGYETTEIHYSPSRVNEQEKKRIGQLLISSLELITSYSKSPLRFASAMGFAASGLSLIYIIYVLAIKIFQSNVPQGWAALSFQLAIMSFFMFAILAIVCEYIGLILQESRGQPPYHIADELISKVSVANSSKRNIMH